MFWTRRTRHCRTKGCREVCLRYTGQLCLAHFKLARPRWVVGRRADNQEDWGDGT